MSNQVMIPDDKTGCLPHFCSDPVSSSITNNNNANIPTKAKFEQELADAMASLSVQEREKSLEQLHGIVPRSTGVSPEEHAKLEHMKEYMTIHANKAYHMAMAQDSAYLENENLLLSFLKSTENGKAEDAAKRLLSYLDYKLSLFGQQTLCREVGLSDLTQEDLNCLLSGVYQYIGNDTAGRPIVISLPWINAPGGFQSWMKCHFLGDMVCCPEQDPNRRDVVALVYCADKPEAPKVNVGHILQLVKMFGALPLKPVSTHVVMGPSNDSLERRLVFGVLSTMTKHEKARTHIHMGSDMFIHYELRRFGIDASSKRFPVDLNGEYKPWSAHLYVEEIRRREQMQLSSVGAAQGVGGSLLTVHQIIPGDNDVLLGHSMECKYHPGNVAFRNVVPSYYAAYDAAHKTGKASIVQQVIARCESNQGGRFLRYCADSDTWLEETDKKLLAKKIGSAFRAVRRNAKQSAQQQP